MHLTTAIAKHRKQGEIVHLIRKGAIVAATAAAALTIGATTPAAAADATSTRAVHRGSAKCINWS
jgi:hypothetical protein